MIRIKKIIYILLFGIFLCFKSFSADMALGEYKAKVKDLSEKIVTVSEQGKDQNGPMVIAKANEAIEYLKELNDLKAPDNCKSEQEHIKFYCENMIKYFKLSIEGVKLEEKGQLTTYESRRYAKLTVDMDAIEQKLNRSSAEFSIALSSIETK